MGRAAAAGAATRAHLMGGGANRGGADPAAPPRLTRQATQGAPGPGERPPRGAGALQFQRGGASCGPRGPCFGQGEGHQAQRRAAGGPGGRKEEP